jgi:hypothetical protein
MENIEMKVIGDKLVMTIDLSQVGKASSTGKTKLIASTRGATRVEYTKRPGITAAVNVMVPA